MPLRIAMVVYTHYESDPRVRREAEALAKRGDHVEVWCLKADGAAAEELLEGVHLHRISIPRYRGGKAAAYVQSYGQFLVVAGAKATFAHVREAFDIVHVHTMPDFLVFAAALPKLRGAKVILDMHDLMPDLYALKFGLDKGGVGVKALRAVQSVSASFADAVICVHEPQYNLLLRDGIPAYKLHIVMNAPDPKLFAPRKRDPKIKDEIRVVYHGTILHRYGVDLAVRAFAKAREQEPRLVMSVLGDGDYVQDVKALAAELGLGPDVLRFSNGRLPLPEVAAQIRDAHIGIIANRDDQEDSVLPTKLLEYMAIGIPSVAPRTRCIRRYFGDAELELAEVGDVDGLAAGLVRLASDKDRRKAVIAAAREWHATFGYEVQMRLLCRLVDSLCWQKVAEQRKAKQKATEGKKTGRRNTPPKVKAPTPA